MTRFLSAQRKEFKSEPDAKKLRKFIITEVPSLEGSVGELGEPVVPRRSRPGVFVPPRGWN